VALVDRIMILLGYAAIFLLLLSFLSPFIPPSSFFVFAFLGLIQPWLFLINGIFLVYWFLRFKGYGILFLLLFVLGKDPLSGFVGLNGSHLNESDSSIKVMSYNIARLYNIKDVNKRVDSENTFQELVGFLKKEKPDILCIGEMHPDYVELLKKSLDYAYVTTTNKSGKYEFLAVYSNYPIKKSEEIVFADSFNANIYADININGSIFRVYNVHLKTNKITDLTSEFIRPNLDNKARVSYIKSMLRRFSAAAIEREKEAQIIAESIDKSPYPVILCGDFNDTPGSYTYRTLSKGLKDAFKEKGRGMGTTFAGNIPALKIDYIFVDERIEVKSHRIERILFSDHFPLIATLLLPK
jgi:endonuclease/exonuclease/phosphatase family metal-dependent hydrolase